MRVSIQSIFCVLHLAIPSLSLAGVPPTLAGDFNADGLVSHADYSVLADGFGSVFTQSDFDVYLANYGNGVQFAPSILPVSISPTATVDGDVEWTIAFSNVNGGVGGHLSIRVDGPDAPNILSMTPGTSFTNNLPGAETFPWVDVTDVDPGPDLNEHPIGVQHDNLAHEAYAALGTNLGQPFSNSTLTFVTLVTEGQNPTTLRILGGTGFSEYGYGGTDYYYLTDQVASFAPIPEPSSLLLAVFAAAIAVAHSARPGRRPARRHPINPL